MTITLSTPHNAARLQATLDYLDTGTGNAAVRIYGGTRPATPDDTPTSTILAQVELTKPCGTITDATLTLTPLANGLITTTGIATWGRIVNANGDTAFDCDAGEGVGAWEIQLEQTSLFAGGDCIITSATLG